MNMPDQRSPVAQRRDPALRAIRGYVLLPVAIGISLVATIALLLNMESVNDSNQAGAELQASQVQYLAEAALAHASWHMQNNVCSGDFTFQNTLAGYGHYSAQLSAEASTVNHYTLPVISDTYIDEHDPAQIRGSQTELHIGNDENDERRALLQFDLSAIPESEHIVEATAWFYVTKYESDSALAIHAVTGSWTEAGATWTSMAASIDPAPYGAIFPRAAGTWVSVNLTALAQYWLNVGSANHGLLVMAPAQSNESRFSSREANVGLRPRLEIITADGPVSPVQLTTTATLAGKPSPANDISRTLTRSAITAYQSVMTQVLQPRADSGKDGRLEDWRPLRHDGESRLLQVSGGSGNTSHSLLQFTLNIPADAKIESAVLSLFQNSASALDAVANVHRMTNAWDEGSGNGNNGTGSSWLLRSGLLQFWTTPGGEMDQDLIASTAIPAGQAGWASWDISDLVQGWANGSYPNYGLALIPGTATTELRFDSSDTPIPAQRPILTISYRCECGSPCLTSSGSGKILMVVNNSLILGSSDSAKKARFESWGYTVTPISQGSLQLFINSAAANNDVIYVSESVSASVLRDKLTNLATGIVSESGAMNSKLGIAASHAYVVSSSIDISDNAHFISAVFPPGESKLYTGAMEQQVIVGGKAAGLQQLGDTASQGSLAILEAGAALGGEHMGETAAGRRVLLPLGRESNLDWNLVHGNGLLLVHRALAWAQQTD